MLAAGLRQLSVQFAKGDRHARRDAFWIAEKLGSEFLTSKKAFDETLAGDRQAILDAYVARQAHRNVSAASSPVFAPPSCWMTTRRTKPTKSDNVTAAISADPSPDVVLQALLADDLMAFTEFAFGVVRPRI